MGKSFSLLDMYSRPISFLPVLGRLTGDAIPALWLSAALEWQRIAGAGEWWTRTAPEWREACFLTRRDQERARRAWKALGVLEERRAGALERPGNALAFRVDVEALDALIRRAVSMSKSEISRASKCSNRTVQKCTKRTVQKCTKRTVVVVSNLPISKEQRVEGVGGEAQNESGKPDRARTSSTKFVPPSLEEWRTHCRGLSPAWSLADVDRAHASARAAGWTKSRGGAIRDWRAHAETCLAVWRASREGREAERAARRAEPSPEELERLERATRAAEEARRARQTAAPTPRTLPKAHAELLSSLGIKPGGTGRGAA